MTNTIDDLERIAKKYTELEQERKKENDAELVKLAKDIVDAISLPSFSFPLKEETQATNGITTYVYENNATFPALYNFLAEVLHSKIPIELGNTKFGPGEITVSKEGKREADAKLAASIKELQELVHAKRSGVLSKYTAITTASPSSAATSASDTA